MTVEYCLQNGYCNGFGLAAAIFIQVVKLVSPSHLQYEVPVLLQFTAASFIIYVYVMGYLTIFVETVVIYSQMTENTKSNYPLVS